MIRHFNRIVFGTGPAVTRIAKRGAKALKVAIAAAREVGGECELRGCNPRTVFVGAAKLMDAVRRSDGKLINVGSALMDWPQLVAF